MAQSHARRRPPLIAIRSLCIGVATTLLAAGSGCSTRAENSHLSGGSTVSASPDLKSPPILVIDGRDLGLGTGVVTASNVCQDSPGSRFKGVKKRVAWRAVTDGTQPDTVTLVFPEKLTQKPMLLVTKASKELYESTKRTELTVDESTKPWYQFSGTIAKVTDDLNASTPWTEAAPLTVKGSIACANYGAPF